MPGNRLSGKSLIPLVLSVIFHATDAHASGNALPRADAEALAMADANVALSAGPAALAVNPANAVDSGDRGNRGALGALFGRVSARHTRAPTVPDEEARTGYPLVTYAAATFAVSDAVTAGFSVDTPHGLGVTWPNHAWDVAIPFTPYVLDLAHQAELDVVRAGPSLAWNLDDHWSVGARVFAQYVRALDRSDFATAEADGSTAGSHIGVRYRRDDFVAAAAYTSRTDTKIRGALRDVHPVVSASVTAGPATSHILLPGRLQSGVALRLWPGLWWELDLDWIGWSYVSDLTIVQADGRFANAGRNGRDNDDTLSVRTALRWQYRPDLLLYSGIGHDPTPVADRDASPVTSMLRKTRVAIGARYSLSGRVHVDVAYQYVHGHARHVYESLQDDLDAIGDTGVYEGTYASHTHVLGVSVTAGL